ncbi:S-adenosylmethionine synthetase [Mucinivorans hirudinis]|uniref:S-adenosylmethionine synthase n=1 Tax=Mucinivorans hirudinis TaxID=1433126 RepID=A0A060RB38_9BACT|nr:S-adenosylmethionine synthetase [Mucinivorans hirudinis]
MSYLYTSESVSEGHPDKVSDQISDAILDEFLKQDPQSKVACETLCTTGLVVVSGEVKSDAYVDIQGTVREVIEKIGYNNADLMFESKSCGVLSAIHEQSPDINQGVERATEEEQGAGDQGMMFGYATNETAALMPATAMLSHIILQELSKIRRQGKVMTYLRPDAKSQVTIEYDDNNKPQRVHTIVVSTQHADCVEVSQIKTDIQNILMPRVKSRLADAGDHLLELIKDDYILYVNPTGKFVIGGPAGDTGLTGRKIIVDTYGGRSGHGGGAFSGKDSSKVDRSAAYAMRYIAKNLVAAGVAEQVQVQVAYAIGVAEPVSLYVNTFGTSKVAMKDGEIAAKLKGLFDLRPAKIVSKFGLKKPIFYPTASYGHFGREPYVENGVQFFGWELLDSVDMLRKEFGI